MELEDRARRSPFPPIHRLGGYFVLDPRRALTLIQSERLLADLKAFATTDQQVADHVYREPDLREPTGWAVDPSDDDYFPQQGYLKGGVLGPHANWGINADCSAVWGLYDGNGIGLVDFEVTWNVGHEDLPAAVHPLYNINQFNPAKFDYGDHGTAVLGIVLGQDNAKGVVGVAPKGTLKRLVSRIKSQTDEWDVVGALLAALDPGVMNLGDVLLVEVETVVGNPLLGCPIEIVDHWFDAVRLVVGNGMVVVEAAGARIGLDRCSSLAQSQSEQPELPRFGSNNGVSVRIGRDPPSLTPPAPLCLLWITGGLLRLGRECLHCRRLERCDRAVPRRLQQLVHR
jgi:hypothetical protein